MVNPVHRLMPIQADTSCIAIAKAHCCAATELKLKILVPPTMSLGLYSIGYCCEDVRQILYDHPDGSLLCILLKVLCYQYYRKRYNNLNNLPTRNP